jgi:hypothetical protein
MRLLPNLHVKGKPAGLTDRAICRQSHYFIYRPRIRHADIFLIISIGRISAFEKALKTENVMNFVYEGFALSLN